MSAKIITRLRLISYLPGAVRKVPFLAFGGVESVGIFKRKKITSDSSECQFI